MITESDKFLFLRMSDIFFENLQSLQCNQISNELPEKAPICNSSDILRRLWTRMLENISGKFPFRENLKT